MAANTERMTVAQYRELPKLQPTKVVPHSPMDKPLYEPQEERPSGLRFTFTHSGPVPSNNTTYAGLHWSKRKALVDKWHCLFRLHMAAAGVQPMQKFSLHLRYNSKHDVDNLSLLGKLAVDTMKGHYIPDDTKKHYRGIHVQVDEGLPHNHFVFTISELL